jgi:predicted kinase
LKVIIILGLPGSGKSFLASKLAERISALYVSSDQIRNKTIPNKTYTEKEKKEVYNTMLSILEQSFAKNKNLVFDATFYTADLRELFLKKCKELRIEYYLIEVIAEPSLIIKRLSKKRPDSDADLTIYEKIKKQFEAVKEAHLILESRENNIDAMLLDSLNYIENGKTADS